MSIGAGQLIKLLLRHGQIPLVYPGAFFVEGTPDVPSSYALNYEDLELQTSDNVKIKCYLIKRPEGSQAKASIIMFHGNGMDYGDQISLADKFFKYGCNVMTVSYRGYANCEGVPSERGLQRDAQAALDYLTTHEPFSSRPIMLYGLSLGGAVAIDLCCRNPTKVHALIVENTFKSLPDVVRGWPGIGIFSFLVFQRWNSASKIPRIPSTIPILMLSGTLDQVVPQQHMLDIQKLAGDRHCSSEKNNGMRWRISAPSRRASTDSKEKVIASKDAFHEFDRGDHANTWMQPGYWEKVSDFMTHALSTSRS